VRPALKCGRRKVARGLSNCGIASRGPLARMEAPHMPRDSEPDGVTPVTVPSSSAGAP
jgi:hypothetical protein